MVIMEYVGQANLQKVLDTMPERINREFINRLARDIVVAAGVFIREHHGSRSGDLKIVHWTLLKRFSLIFIRECADLEMMISSNTGFSPNGQLLRWFFLVIFSDVFVLHIAPYNMCIAPSIMCIAPPIMCIAPFIKCIAPYIMCIAPFTMCVLHHIANQVPTCMLELKCIERI